MHFGTASKRNVINFITSSEKGVNFRKKEKFEKNSKVLSEKYEKNHG
jgi:hypothetical protein